MACAYVDKYIVSKESAMYIKSVTIEGMRNVKYKKYELSQLVYLHGPNGAGKSTVLNAIQLCLLGYIPGTAKSNAAIMEHANGNRIEVTVELGAPDWGDHTIEATRTFERKSRTVTSDFSLDGFGSDPTMDQIMGDSKLPVFDWNSFTSLTSNKLKDWFIQFIPGMNEDVDWMQELESAVNVDVVYNVDIVKEYADKFSKIDASSAVDSVIEANSMLKNDVSYCKAALAEKENAVNGLLDSFDISDSENMDVDALQQQYDAAVKEYDAAQASYMDKFKKYTSALNRTAQINKLSDDLSRMLSVEDIESKQAELQSSIDDMVSLQDDLRIDIESAKSQKQAALECLAECKANIETCKAVVDSDSSCPYTKLACESIARVKPKYASNLKQYTSDANSYKQEAEQCNSKIKHLEQQLSQAQLDKQEYSKRISELDFKLSQRKAAAEKLEKAASAVAESVTQEEVNEAQQLMDSAKKLERDLSFKLNTAVRIKQNADLVESMMLEKYKLQEKLDILNAWVKLTGANGLQTKLSSKGFTDLEQKLTPYVQELFGSMYSCKFNVAQKANSFSFGIEKHSKLGVCTYIPYNLLSTGEKTVYAYMLMKYIADNSNSLLKLVMMDDFFDHLDKQRFASLLYTMSSSSTCQVIMAGVVDCNCEAVKVIEI